MPQSLGAFHNAENPLAEGIVKPKGDPSHSTRAIPERWRLEFLQRNEDFKKALKDLNRARKKFGPKSKEHDMLRARIEEDYELPYLPDSVLGRSRFKGFAADDRAVKIMRQDVPASREDPRLGFHCHDCGHTFLKLVKACKGKLKVAGGKAKCPECGSKRTGLLPRFFNKPINVKDNRLHVEIDTRYLSKKIRDEIAEILSCLEKAGEIASNRARRREVKYREFLDCYDLSKRFTLGQIAAKVYPDQWRERPASPSDEETAILEPTPQEIAERAKKYREQKQYGYDFSFKQAKEDLTEAKHARQISADKNSPGHGQRDFLIRKALRQKVWRNVQEARRLISSIGTHSHLKI